MPSLLDTSARLDARHIDVNGEAELRGWAKRFGVTADVLRSVVASIGDRPDAVESHFRQCSEKRRSGDREGPNEG